MFIKCSQINNICGRISKNSKGQFVNPIQKLNKTDVNNLKSDQSDVIIATKLGLGIERWKRQQKSVRISKNYQETGQNNQELIE